MKIFFSANSVNFGKRNNLISVGLVSEDGRTFYAEFNDYNENELTENDLLTINQLKHSKSNDKRQEYCTRSELNDAALPPGMYNIDMRGDIKTIGNTLTAWMFNQFNSPVELWCESSSYEWNLFISIFGNVYELPRNISPVYAFDFSTALKMKGFNAYDVLHRFSSNNELMEQIPSSLKNFGESNTLLKAYVVKICSEYYIDGKLEMEFNCPGCSRTYNIGNLAMFYDKLHVPYNLKKATE